MKIDGSKGVDYVMYWVTNTNKVIMYVTVGKK